METLLVDAHLDMAYNAVVLGRDLQQPVSEIRRQEQQHPLPDARAGTSTVSIPALLAGRVAVIGASLFVAPEIPRFAQPQVYRTADEAHQQALAQLDYYRRLAETDTVTLLEDEAALDAVLLRWAEGQPHLGLFVVMEGADPIRTPAELPWWVERGLRGVGLAWAMGTRYAGGNGRPGPLTADGEALLDAMAEYNLLLDLSHLWEEAAYAALGRYPGPLCATHANPRAFVDSPRSLSDALIRRIAKRDGVVGVVPYNRMLVSGWQPGEPRPPLERVAEVVDYICQLTGSAAHIGIGSDMDGGFGMESLPETLDSITDLGRLGELLTTRGYSSADVTAILGENWLRVLRAALAAF